MKKTADASRWIFYSGIAAMILLIIGVLSEPSSLPQKSLFLIGSVVLTVVAHLNKQRMLLALQSIITLGSILAFVDLGGIIKYILLFGASAVVIWYLVSIKNYKKDPWSISCTAGLILVAIGYVTDATADPLYFGLYLGLGSLLVALYSFIDYFYNKDKIAIIWFILNVVFAINPILLVISALKA
ncbi:MAG: hypothetical protein PHF60_05495 [Candidatus ainarchaeum sp.]|nr:hypothetical protein [Candidatus ainarchaeum sp.]